MKTILSYPKARLFIRLVASSAIYSVLPLHVTAQNIGFNVLSPTSPVQMQEAPGTMLGHLESVLDVQYSGTSEGGASPAAIKGFSKPTESTGYGGLFTGGKAGVAGFGGGNGPVTFGLYGFASGYAEEAIGVFGSAFNGGKNWAGYFGNGNVYVTNLLGIGQENPAFAIDILKPQAVMRFQTTSHVNGSVIDLRNTMQSPDLLGAINFASEIATPGQISYLASDWLTFRAGGAERVRIGAEAIGVNQSNPTAPLHVKQAPTVQLGDGEAVAFVEYTGTNNDDAIAIMGVSRPAPDKGTGGNFEGGRIGVRARGKSTGSGSIGVYAIADSPGLNYGIYALAAGSSDGWAGWFAGRLWANVVGIGRVPVTNKLEVEGNASKSSAGNWVANSDARLKKNITPLQPEDMIHKLLSLQGVTYEWNDTATGSFRPEGIQYGFTAQNIQESFPTLVEMDNSGYLQTAYGTYDPMMVEAIRFLYEENQLLRSEISSIKASIEQLQNVSQNDNRTFGQADDQSQARTYSPNKED